MTRKHGAAVKDFCQHPLVERVIVISNNSSDQTIERAQEAGALSHIMKLNRATVRVSIVACGSPPLGRCSIIVAKATVHFARET
jgi:hypothetical protein